MEFQKLLDTQVTDQEVKKEIQYLLEKKIVGEELNEGPKIQILNDFLEQKITYYNDYLKTTKQASQLDTTILNELFRQTLEEAWQ